MQCNAALIGDVTRIATTCSSFIKSTLHAPKMSDIRTRVSSTKKCSNFGLNTMLYGQLLLSV